MINPITLIKALKLGPSAAKKMMRAADLLFDRNIPEKCQEGIRLLDSIGVGSNPHYGEEIICAAVYYMKALFNYSLDDIDNASYCLQVVEDIPSWYVIFGHETLMDIKSSAKDLEDEL